MSAFTFAILKFIKFLYLNHKKPLMDTLITCPKCQHKFAPQEAIAQALEKEYQDGKCKGAHFQNESFKRYLNFFQHILTRLYPIKFQCEAPAGVHPAADK